AKEENVDFKIGGGMGQVRSHTGTGQDTILKKQAESGVFVRNPYRSPTKKMATRNALPEPDGTARSIDLGAN
ncbi:oleate hydratase, partial [Bifidobacterium pseudocatenulatum]|nr:oleate hydratase [Bifidobacterium pseudocatenulatum]